MTRCHKCLFSLSSTIAILISTGQLHAEDPDSTSINSRKTYSEAISQSILKAQNRPLVQLTGLESDVSGSEYGHTQYELSADEHSADEVEHECWWCRIGLCRNFAKHQRAERKKREVRLVRKVKGQSYYENFPAYYTMNHGYHQTCWRKMTESCDRCPPTVSALSPTLEAPVLEVAPPVPAAPKPAPAVAVPSLPKK